MSIRSLFLLLVSHVIMLGQVFEDSRGIDVHLQSSAACTAPPPPNPSHDKNLNMHHGMGNDESRQHARYHHKECLKGRGISSGDGLANLRTPRVFFIRQPHVHMQDFRPILTTGVGYTNGSVAVPQNLIFARSLHREHVHGHGSGLILTPRI